MQLQDITIIAIIMVLKWLPVRSCNRDYVVRTEQNRLFGGGFDCIHI